MTTTSKPKNSKESNDYLPFVIRLQSLILAGNQEYVPESSMQEEKICIYKSQLVIPFSIFSKIRALMDPLMIL